MMKRECTDNYLIKLAKKGNQQAYNDLLERYTHKIKQIIFFYVNEQANVNDLVQEVMLKVFCHLNYFKEESQFSTWLYRIIQNTVKNHFRTITQRVDFEAQLTTEQGSAFYYSPEHQLLNLEFYEQIDNAISRLSKDLRECYGLHIEGQTYEDIAREMDCPVGTVRSRIFRARKLMIDYVSRHN